MARQNKRITDNNPGFADKARHTLQSAFITVGVYCGLYAYFTDNKPEDKTIPEPPGHTGVVKSVRGQGDEVPYDTRGAIPLKNSAKKISADKSINVDDIFKEGEALTKGYLNEKLPQKTPAISAAQPERERIEDMKTAPPVKGQDKPDEWVPIEHFMEKANPGFLPPKSPEKEKIKPEIKKPAEPKAANNTPSTTVSRAASRGLPQFVKLTNNGDHIYTVGPKIIPVSADVMKAFRHVSREKNLPVEVFISTCGRESFCQPRAVHKVSKACGLFQFMPTRDVQTLFRLAYTQGPAHGYPEARELVKQYVFDYDKKGRAILHYAPKNPAAEKKLAELCLDPHFSTSVYAADLKHQVSAYEAFLRGGRPTGRKAVVGEITLMDNLGVGGMQKFFLQVMADKKAGHDTMARDFFSKAVAEQNPSLVKYPDSKVLQTDKNGKVHEIITEGRYKTLRETYDLISENGGWRAPDELPGPSRQL